MGQSLKNPRSGFTLLEIMLSLAILAVLSLSFILFLIWGLKLLSFSERADVANSLAAEMVGRVVEKEVEIHDGVFDGRSLDPQILGFPPSPYPAKTLGREYTFKVYVISQDERLWQLRVEVYEDEHRAAVLETLVKK